MNMNSGGRWGSVSLKEENTFASLEIEEKGHKEASCRMC